MISLISKQAYGPSPQRAVLSQSLSIRELRQPQFSGILKAKQTTGFPLKIKLHHGLQFGWLALKHSIKPAIRNGLIAGAICFIPFLHFALLSIPLSMGLTLGINFVSGFYRGFKLKPKDIFK